MIPRQITLERMYQTPDWFDLGLAEMAVVAFDELIPSRIFQVAASLGELEKADKLPQKIDQIFEFGGSFGEGLVALEMFATSRGSADVMGSEVDLSKNMIATMVADLLPNVHSVERDGFSVLEESPDRFDVILANWFGPSYEDESMPSVFIPLALRALRLGGIAIINSDEETMRNVRSFAERTLESQQLEVVELELLPEIIRNRLNLLIKK